MEISIEKITRIIKKYFLIILASAIAFFGIAFAYSKLFISPTYYATAKFYIKDPSWTSTTSSTITATRLLADTFVAILDTDNFGDSVNKTLAEDAATSRYADEYSGKSIHSGSKYTVVDSTEVITVSFSSKEKDSVIPITNAILTSLQTHLDGAYGSCDVYFVEFPSKPSVSSSKTTTICVIAAIIGALLAVAILFLRDTFDIHIKTSADLIERYNISLLGVVPEFDTSAAKNKASDTSKTAKAIKIESEVKQNGR